MRIIELFRKLKCEDAVALYREYADTNTFHVEETLDRDLAKIKYVFEHLDDVPLIDGLVVVIRADEKGGADYDVNSEGWLRTADGMIMQYNDRWAMDGTSLVEWLGMEFRDDTGNHLSDLVAAAHLLQEMTWYRLTR